MKFLLSLSRQPELSWGFIPPLGFPVIWEWIERDLRSESLFPFNAASVCKLWHNILAGIPECWTRVVFDLASDPGPFLNAFLWSRSLEKIDVAIFNSSEYAEEVDEALENERISAIAQALQLHVHRCRSIVIDTIYSSSIPSPNIFFLRDAPNLYTLFLEFRIDNFDASTHPSPPTLGEEQPTFATSFPVLCRLSVPAFWLIDMALFAPDAEWLKQLYPSFMRITIAKFEFPENGPYSLTNLLSCLCLLKEPSSISLRELTLSYEYSGHNLNSPDRSSIAYTISSFADIHFKSTSKDFIAHLYSVANVVSNERLTFEGCEIPNISHLQNARNLCLENIPDKQGLSLRNILASWEGSNLTIRSCPSFDDTLLFWLRSEGVYLDSEGNGIRFMFPAKYLCSLHIYNCIDFTSPALVDVIGFRKDAHTTFVELEAANTDGLVLHTLTSSIYSLSVNERGPTLTQEGMDWFFTNEEDISVSWHTEDDEGEVHVFSCGI